MVYFDYIVISPEPDFRQLIDEAANSTSFQGKCIYCADSLDGDNVAKCINRECLFLIIDMELSMNSCLSTASKIAAAYPKIQVIFAGEKVDAGTDASPYCIQKVSELGHYFGKYLEVNTNGGIKLPIIRTDSIQYLQRDGKYVKYYLDDGREDKTRSSLKDIFCILPQEHFVYINKGIIINTNRMLSFEKESVQLSGNDNVPVSLPLSRERFRRLRKEFPELYLFSEQQI